MTFLDAGDRAAIERYVIARGLVAADALPVEVTRAGAGNMNLALRVTPSAGRPFILKQGRPWVEKYPHIPAPAERTLVEAAFYAAVQTEAAVAARMPAVLQLDADNHVLALEDLGAGGDFTTMYAGAALPTGTLEELLDWLERLASIAVATEQRAILANRAMRELNHEHMFRLPLAADNGLDLDAITPGLGQAARELGGDREYCGAVEALGRRYLADGRTLVHGDYFPGSWMKGQGGVRVIDPEFCFLGDREFDYGVLAAHLAMTQAGASALGQVTAAVDGQRLNADLVHKYAGVEIMRRLIGVAQLPIVLDLERKRGLLQLARRLVLMPREGLA